MKVTPEKTLEVALAQWWSSLGSVGTVALNIDFHGFAIDTFGCPSGTNHFRFLFFYFLLFISMLDEIFIR
jgi:hypothetical protein